MALKFSKQLKNSFKAESKVEFDELKKFNFKDMLTAYNKAVYEKNFKHFLFPFVFLFLIFGAVFLYLFKYQVLSFAEFKSRSENNQFEVAEIKPNRGIILDKKGRALAVNVPAVNIFVAAKTFKNESDLRTTTQKLQEIIGDSWRKGNEKENFTTLFDRSLAIWNGMDEKDRNWVRSVEIVSGLSNEMAVAVKAKKENLPDVYVEDGSKRSYPYGESASFLTGYTGDVFAEDLEKLSYVSYNDVIGKTGLEKLYDQELFGIKGKFARNLDGGKTEIVHSISGSTLSLSIDAVAQKKMYEILRSGVNRFRADGGAFILEDISTGEIISLASYPSFNSNIFANGISQKDYEKLLKQYKNPLLNRAIGAQVPPGSTFKTIVASAALDAGAITRSTVYISKRGYLFSNGEPFQEFQNHAYGALDLIDAITVSSNIYFCEVIRNWNMDKLVPYLEKFGIGNYTYIDLPGEGIGRLPSPENKIELAKSSPWIGSVWYPEGDSCNSVIGQGITTVTPIQMVNWISAIANGGTLLTPHLVAKITTAGGEEKVIEAKPLNTKIAKDFALAIVREGMWSSVNGARRVIAPLTDAKVTVAAKTGTAEFGKKNYLGEYSHTHAWVTGFFPYEKPEYAFVVFLEDGGASNNSATLAREFIDWFTGYQK